MSTTERLTDSTIRALKAPERGQKLYYDATLAGFAVRVSQGGSKSFVLQHGSDRRMMTLGRYPVISLAQARDEARKLLAEFTLGRIRPQSMTYDQAVKVFLEEKSRSKRPGTVREYKRLLERHFPYRGQLTGVTVGWVTHRLAGLSDVPSEFNHALVAGKAFFNWCLKKRLVTENPFFALSQHHRPKRKRVLSDEELKAVWNAAGGMGSHFGRIVQLLICCGQREGETAAIRAEYLKDDLCTFPGSLTKNGRQHTFPLSTFAKGLLNDGPQSGLFFLARGHTNKAFYGWGVAKADLDERSGVTGWTLHDLRRTFRTGLASLGVAPHIAERLVNHISARTEMEETYDLYLSEMREAMKRWDGHLSKLLENNPQRRAA